jgi:hypothetical protein
LRLRAILLPALTASLVLFVVAVAASLVRVLPFLLDPRVPLRAAWPFARGLLGLAGEASLLVGWPIGWAIATARRVDRGEARLFALLGESPWRTALRLLPEAAALSLALGAVSLAGGKDAEAPGGVVDALLAQARASCAHATKPAAYAVPLANATWLCRPRESGGPVDVRLALDASAFFGASSAPVTATSAEVAGDLRAIDLTDARFSVFSADASTDSGAGATPLFRLHAGHVHLQGLPPWARASSLAAWARALMIVASAFFASTIAVAKLLATRASPGPWLALASGAAGPLAALGVLRLLETRGTAPLAFVLVPIAAALAAWAFATVADRFARLPSRNPAATT